MKKKIKDVIKSVFIISKIRDRDKNIAQRSSMYMDEHGIGKSEKK